MKEQLYTLEVTIGCKRRIISTKLNLCQLQQKMSKYEGNCDRMTYWRS